MPKTIDITLVVYLGRLDKKPCNHEDAETFDQIMNEEDFFCIDHPDLKLVDETWDTPEEIGGKVCIVFYLKVGHKKAGATPKEILKLVDKSYGLYLHDIYDVLDEDIYATIRLK